MKLALAFLISLLTLTAHAGEITGAWQQTRDDGATGVWILTDTHFSIAWYVRDPAKFGSTEGGTWKAGDKGLQLTYEYDTANPNRVGTTAAASLDGWKRIDHGAKTDLSGAWLMTGRKRDGQISTRTPGARRTMKILSGTRFQWIAYNVETKEFFGTGGGTYTAKDGKYVESLEFFSRDNAKSGRSLEFQYEFADGTWHHIGKSTAGEPMHEVWSRREKLGI